MIDKSSAYHARKHRAYAERKSAKHARAKAAQRTQPTPRNSRTRRGEPNLNFTGLRNLPSMMSLLSSVSKVRKFEAASYRKVAAA